MATNEQPLLHIPAQQMAMRQEYHAGERVRSALALLLGDDTDDETRWRAGRRLARQGPTLLPLVLETLNRCPEFTTPVWPWWPPQYEHCARLLLRLSRAASVQLDSLLHHPAVYQPAGPVLWTSIIEAAAQAPDEGYESLFREGLQAPWHSTRYAAAVALGNLAGSTALAGCTIIALRTCQHESWDLPLRLAASHALLRHGDSHGLDVLLTLFDPAGPEQARKAAAFVLASESPLRGITQQQREQLQRRALSALSDHDPDIGLYAADILSGIATPSLLPLLCLNLRLPNQQAQIATLTLLEGIAPQKAMRPAIYKSSLPAQTVALLRSNSPEVRRQAAYTLAAFGGPYAAAALGATLLDAEQRGRIEAIEGLRLLPDTLRPKTRERATRWLLNVLGEATTQGQEEAQVTALDSLSYIAWQAFHRGRTQAYGEMSRAIWDNGIPLQLLASDSAWVRQRAIELLGLLAAPPAAFLTQLTHMLRHDDDSGVRACAAYMLGQMQARTAIPDLILALLDPDESVAETALNTLGRLATAADSIVVYVLRELAASPGKRKRASNQLARTARAILREMR